MFYLSDTIHRIPTVEPANALVNVPESDTLYRLMGN